MHPKLHLPTTELLSGFQSSLQWKKRHRCLDAGRDYWWAVDFEIKLSESTCWVISILSSSPHDFLGYDWTDKFHRSARHIRCKFYKVKPIFTDLSMANRLIVNTVLFMYYTIIHYRMCIKFFWVIMTWSIFLQYFHKIHTIDTPICEGKLWSTFCEFKV